jgi:SAM-dependent methyltransferase
MRSKPSRIQAVLRRVLGTAGLNDLAMLQARLRAWEAKPPPDVPGWDEFGKLRTAAEEAQAGIDILASGDLHAAKELDALQARLRALEAKPPPDVPGWNEFGKLRTAAEEAQARIDALASEDLRAAEELDGLQARLRALEAKPLPDVPGWQEFRTLENAAEGAQGRVDNDLRQLRSAFEASRNRIITLESSLPFVAQERIKNLEALRKALDKVPSLRTSEPKMKVCKICGGMSKLFDVVDFHKYCGQQEMFVSDIAGIEVSYYRCEICDFTFTDFCDDWTKDDFSRYIYNEEYVLVDPEYESIRPIYTADNMAKILSDCEQLRIIDYGAGSGRFAYEMQKRGFASIQNYDPFSSPDLPEGRFDVACLFEVIEHMPDPLASLRTILSQVLKPEGIIILTQSIQPDTFEQIRGRWWYLGPRNGHISTFSEVTFRRICANLHMRFFNLRPGYYVFCREGVVYQWALLNFMERHDRRSVETADAA